VSKRPSMAPYEGFGKRAPSDLPPVLTPAERASVNGSPLVGTNGAATGHNQTDGAHANGEVGSGQRDEATTSTGSRD